MLGNGFGQDFGNFLAPNRLMFIRNVDDGGVLLGVFAFYSGLNLNQDKATKPQTVQIVRQGEATPYWFKFNPL